MTRTTGMLLALGFSLLLHAQAQAQAPGSSRQHDSLTKAINDRVERQIARRAAQKAKRTDSLRTLTPQLLATAFKDAPARDLLTRARRARFVQDSTLDSYDATAYQRVSAWFGISKLGRARLAFRTEASGHVQWKRDVGVWMNVTGSRTVLPGIPDIGEREANKGIRESSGDMVPVPYYPGTEPLWAGQELMHDTVEVEGPIHPLAVGSEAYYTYATGDSVTLKLQNGQVIPLRSLEVRPREPRWNLVVGSLWFDVRTGQLVRAAYRFAVPMHIDQFVLDEDPTAFDDVPAWVKPMMFPMSGEIAAVTIEYGLYGTGFWLPRVRTAEGEGRASFMRVPFSLEQTFKYASVNAIDSLPRIPLPPSPPASLDSAGRRAWRDSVRTVRQVAARAHRDSVRAHLISARPVSQCDTSDIRVSTHRIADGHVPIGMRVPCDSTLLENSPDLPKSIYDPGDELLDAATTNALVAQALALGAQPPLTLRLSMLPRPTIENGLRLMRYNRVEGASAAATIDQELGGGYTLSALGRVATARWLPTGELTLTRSNLQNAIFVTGYDRLVAASDWGNPLSFGSSVSGVLFGRDEGFYYRTAGGEVGTRSLLGVPVEVRMFAEREQTARVATTFGLMTPNSLSNIGAEQATYVGGALRMRGVRGEDPNGFRIFSDWRVEAARGDSLYGRTALDLTFTHSIGDIAAALTLSGGSSVGHVPTQRLWYLGGSHTIRGQRPDTAASGDAFWMTRAELGKTIQGARAVVFSDLGWAGDRNRMQDVGRPLTGVGIGASFYDGLIRFDLARGIYPRKQLRFDAYLEGVF